eukprot:2426225-Rhodomonas_salina.1
MPYAPLSPEPSHAGDEPHHVTIPAATTVPGTKLRCICLRAPYAMSSTELQLCATRRQYPGPEERREESDGYETLRRFFLEEKQA